MGVYPCYLSVLKERPLASAWSSVGYRVISPEVQLGQNLCYCSLHLDAQQEGMDLGSRLQRRKVVPVGPGSSLREESHLHLFRPRGELAWGGYRKIVDVEMGTPGWDPECATA